MTTLGLVIHNIADGLALGASLFRKYISCINQNNSECQERECFRTGITDFRGNTTAQGPCCHRLRDIPTPWGTPQLGSRQVHASLYSQLPLDCHSGLLRAPQLGPWDRPIGVDVLGGYLTVGLSWLLPVRGYNPHLAGGVLQHWHPSPPHASPLARGSRTWWGTLQQVHWAHHNNLRASHPLSFNTLLWMKDQTVNIT